MACRVPRALHRRSAVLRAPLSRERLSPEYADLVSYSNPTVEVETEYLPWDPVHTVGAAADRIDRFDR